MAEGTIGDILGRTVQALGALEQTLGQEAEALTAQQRDADAIGAIAQRKQGLVAEINDLVRLCDRLLAGLGLAAGRVGVESWLTHLPANDTTHSAWRTLLEASARCKQLNETNGVQISLLNRRAQEALNVLLGADGGNDSYGPDGTGRSVSPSHSSYKA